MNAITKIGFLKDADLFRQRALIGDVWQHAHSNETVDVTDPASLEVLGTVPDMGIDETRAAIDAAQAALYDWKARTHAERAAFLESWHSLI
ncbi:aldehyde dehydrogenase family protein, partial [Mesorhizobium sp. M4B.F.Ca.ET.017.02.2.1]